MSQLDPVHEAIERLEWQDSKREETPHLALAGGHAAHRAHRRRRRASPRSP